MKHLHKSYLVIIILFVAIINVSKTQSQTLSNDVEMFLMQHTLQSNSQAKTSLAYFATPHDLGGRQMIDAFVEIDKNQCDILQSYGAIVCSCFDGFVTAQIPINVLEQVMNLPQVQNIEIARPLQLTTDSARAQTRAEQVLQGLSNGLPQNYDGTGVIVAIIDNGFDFKHDAFRDADDPTINRISRVYITYDTLGMPAIAQSQSLPGSVYLGNMIDELNYDSNSTHGTHTATIAAGTHRGAYGGMAPRSEIVLCALKDNSNTTELANCLNYISSYADSVGKPCVISLSLSTNDGPHDGSGYLLDVIRQATGKGRIFVVSAGNNGDKNMYAGGKGSPTNPMRILIESTSLSPSDGSNQYHKLSIVETWWKYSSQRPYYHYWILDRRNHHVVWESAQMSYGNNVLSVDDFGDYFEPDSTVTDEAKIYSYLVANPRANKYDLRTYAINLKPKSYTVNQNGKLEGDYMLGLSIYVGSGETQFYTWATKSETRLSNSELVAIDSVSIDSVSNDTIVTTQYFNDYYILGNADCTIGNIATCDSVISAGAYISKARYVSYLSSLDSLNTDTITVYPTEGAICNFSSYQQAGAGPLGTSLPTVAAPGASVVSAVNRYTATYAYDSAPGLVQVDEDGSRWGVMSGTSMSAPAVAGIVALWLQADSTLTPSDVKAIIAATAIHDQYTEGNCQFGPNGKIDALAGIQYIHSKNAPLLGDVNYDGVVDVKDVTALISYILGNPLQAFNQDVADLDANGEIDVKDVTALISMILSN